MTEEELEQEKKINEEAITLTENNIATMEKTIEIQNYLQEKDKNQKEKDYQKFLNSLTVGEDGTIFAPQRDYKYTTFSLSEFINYAFSLKYYENKCSENHFPYMEITFKEIIEYKKTTRKVLREMRKYSDEKTVQNPYGLEIYPNPKENYECAESTLLTNCIFAPSMYNLQEELETEGMTDVVVNDQLKTIIISDSLDQKRIHFSAFSPVDISTLSMREKNAFFGEEAQKALGVTMDDVLFDQPQEDGTIKKKPLTK